MYLINYSVMNENIDLTKILKDCPTGWKFYSSVYGDVPFQGIADLVYPIQVSNKRVGEVLLSEKGRFLIGVGECILFPSKDQRDWSKFTAPWYKKEKFDPKTLKPFDKVLVSDEHHTRWRCSFFSHIVDQFQYKYYTSDSCYKFCIPYNDDTKHLVGTTDEAPEYYKYWED